MLENIYYNKLTIQELRKGVLGNYIDDFAFHLYEIGYQKKLRSRLAVIRKLNKWLTENKISLRHLNDKRIKNFIKIAKNQKKTFFQCGDKRTLSYFFDYLQSRNVMPQIRPVRPTNESIEKIIQAYVKYLDEDKGLCTSTIKKNKKIIYDFLCKQFGENKFIPKDITQNTLLTHIIKFKEQHALKNIRVMVSALRSFLRFLVMVGKLRSSIVDCIPSMPSWRATHLPVFLVKPEIKKLLRTCDRRTSKGQRNYAILILLIRLGLRASEVLNLTLDNINWDLGELDINGKGRKHRILPLPCDVGNAVASYIRYGRPKCSDRHVFIRTRLPYRCLNNSASISTIVHRALIAAGLTPLQTGAQLLRYTAAMETLSNGGTLFEVGELLGHCSVDTTAIYTKIDVVGLRELAQPWPIK